MNRYRIVPTDDGFEIVETWPDGRKSFIGPFPTEAEAQAWLDNYIRLRRLNGWPLGKPDDPAP